MTVTVTPTPANLSTITSTQTVSFNCVEDNPGMNGPFGSMIVTYSDDGFSTETEMFNSNTSGFQNGFNGSNTVLGTDNGTITFSTNPGFPTGAIVVRVRIFADADGGNFDTSYTVSGGGGGGGGGGTNTFSLEKLILTSPTGTGLYLGTNTVPRNEKRSKFGELLYVWSAETLTDEERGYLGLPKSDNPDSTVPDPGHIDYITIAHGYFDRVDISEVNDTGPLPVRTNIRGVYDSIDWTNLQTSSGLNLMQVYIGTPSRASYAFPATTTHVTGEVATFVDGGGGSGLQSPVMLGFTNHEGPYPQSPNTGGGTGARLYKFYDIDTALPGPDGTMTLISAGTPIPFPDTVDDNSIVPWQFVAQDQIKINSPYYDPTAHYLIDYDLLMRATSEPFQLTDGSSNPSNYVWLADLSMYRRHQVNSIDRPRTEQIQFTSTFTATLKFTADITQSATLTSNNGITEQTVGISAWQFQDDKTVKIDSGTFDVNSIYTLSYTAMVPEIDAEVTTMVSSDSRQLPPTARLEWRQATTEGGLTSASWQTVQSEQILSPTFTTGDDISMNIVLPWHQMRVTITNVNNIRDFRLFGFGMKGIHLFGGSPHAPLVVL